MALALFRQYSSFSTVRSLLTRHTSCFQRYQTYWIPRVISGHSILRSQAAIHTTQKCRSKSSLSRGMSFGNESFPQVARDEDVSDVYHGVSVADPYRVLEDPDNETTKKFVNEVNEFSRPRLDYWPRREELYEKIKNVWDRRRYASASREGNHVYVFTNSGLDNQDILLKDKKPFINLNEEDPSGETSLNDFEWSNGSKRILAYGVSMKGSDDTTIRFKREDGEELEEKVHYAKHCHVSWNLDRGVFYSKYQCDKQSGKTQTMCIGELSNHSLYYHELGTNESSDVVVFEQPEEPKRFIAGQASQCGSYLFISTHRGCDPANQLFVHPLSRRITPSVKPLVVTDTFEFKISVIGNIGNRVFALTDKDQALKNKVVYFDVHSDSCSELTDFVAESLDDKLEWGYLTSAGLVLCYITKRLETKLILVDANTKAVTNVFSGFETISGVMGKFTDERIYMNRESFLCPVSCWELNLPKNDPAKFTWTMIEQSEGINVDDIEVTDDYATSADGEKIHYFLIRTRGEVTEPRPALVYAYGGFNVPLLPFYSITRPLFVKELNGIFAIVNARGGSEFGEDWHRAGMLHKKENVFNDVLAVVDKLVERKLTTNEKVAIEGGSNGGLVVMAAAQKRPDAVAAVVSQVGVLDMLRFPKFTVGAAWKTEYGDAEGNEDDFKYLLGYSPLHNVQHSNLKEFPHVLVLTADHDDRVIPGHSLKFLAELYYQAEKAGVKKNFLGRIEQNAGHGSGLSTSKRIYEIVDIYSFLSLTIGLEFQKPQ